MSAVGVEPTPARRKPALKAPVIQLVPRMAPRQENEYQAEMVDALTHFLAMAIKGELTGLAYVFLRDGEHISAGTLGAASDKPEIATHWLDRLKLKIMGVL